MKNILVTGGEGFIGTHICSLLEGHSLTVADLNTENSCDVRKPEDCEKVVPTQDIIIHLAGLVSVGASIEDPGRFVETNTLGTLNMLEAVRKAGQKPHFILISSGNVYHKASGKASESSQIGPPEPYAASKFAAECLCQAYSASYGIPTTIVRAFSTFGPGQPDHMFIPSLIKQCLVGGDVTMGNLDGKRDFVYVRDVASAFKTIVEKGATGIFNIGTGNLTPVSEIAEIVKELTGFSGEIKAREGNGDNPTNAPKVTRPASTESPLTCDYSHAQKELGWSPQYSLESALRETVESFR